MVHHHHEKETHQFWGLNILSVYLLLVIFDPDFDPMLNMIHLPIYKQGIDFFFGRTRFPSASYQTHQFLGV